MASQPLLSPAGRGPARLWDTALHRIFSRLTSASLPYVYFGCAGSSLLHADFVSGSGQGPLLVVVPGLAVAVASLVSEPRASVVGACGLESPA